MCRSETEIDNGCASALPISMKSADAGIRKVGDYVTIDYTMSVDGQPYPEGDTTGYPLEIGSDTFFPELNDGLFGRQARVRPTTVTTTYPEDYSNKESGRQDVNLRDHRAASTPHDQARSSMTNGCRLISQGALAEYRRTAMRA